MSTGPISIMIPANVVNTTHSDGSLELRVGAGQVLTSLNCLTEAAVDSLPVRTTEHGTRAEERKRIVGSSGIVDGNIPQHVLADLLGQVDVDAQEVSCRRLR
jgi:hypothetical protein